MILGCEREARSDFKGCTRGVYIQRISCIPVTFLAGYTRDDFDFRIIKVGPPLGDVINPIVQLYNNCLLMQFGI